MAGLVAGVENDRQHAVTRFPAALRLRELGAAQNLAGRDRGVVCALRTSMLCPLAPRGVDMNAPPITSPDAALRVWSPFRQHQNELKGYPPPDRAALLRSHERVWRMERDAAHAQRVQNELVGRLIGCELLRRYHAGELHLAGGDPAREGGAGESGGSRHRGHAVAGAVDHGDDVTVDLHAEHHRIGALAALLGELLHQRASGDQRLDRLDVARPAHGFLGHILDAWYAHRWVGLGQQCAEAVSEEGLDIADARDLDDLEPRQRRDLDDLAVPDDARRPQIFVEQILGRPGDHVAIGPFRAGREAADLDVDLFGPACRQRPAGDEVGQAWCEVGHGDVVIAGGVVSDGAALTAATQDDDACHALVSYLTRATQTPKDWRGKGRVAAFGTERKGHS